MYLKKNFRKYLLHLVLILNKNNKVNNQIFNHQVKLIIILFNLKLVCLIIK